MASNARQLAYAAEFFEIEHEIDDFLRVGLGQSAPCRALAELVGTSSSLIGLAGLPLPKSARPLMLRPSVNSMSMMVVIFS